MNSPLTSKIKTSTHLTFKHRLADISNWHLYKDRIAIIDVGQSQSSEMTYAQLNTAVEKLSSLLNSDIEAMAQSQRIGIFLENSAKYAIVLLAIFEAGFIAVPISLKAAQINLDTVAQDCAFVICDSNTIQLLPKKINYKLIDKLIDESMSHVNCRRDTINACDEAVVLYTSGSTGTPKSIIHTHSGLGWKIQTAAQEILKLHPENTTSYLASPICHMNGLSSLLVMLSTYKTIVLTPTFAANLAINILHEKKVISIIGVPAMIAQIISEKTNQTYPSVLSIRLGSAPLSETLLSRIQAVFPHADIRNNYGLTEVGPNLFGEHPTLPRPRLSVGYPRNEIDYRIIDGVLQIKSPSQFKMNGESVYENITKDGYYITKDIFYTDKNGFYFYVGRSDDMIICGGENIYLNNIDCILESHPAVRSAAAVALPDEIKGQKPYAFVVANQSIQKNELMDYLLKHLTKNSVPRDIWFIREIPLSEIGKISRKKLIDMALVNLNKTNI